MLEYRYDLEEVCGQSYRRWLSPRSELPDLLSWDSSSESDESEGDKHITDTVVKTDISLDENTEEERVGVCLLTIWRWSDGWWGATRRLPPHSNWSGFHLRKDSERRRQIHVMHYKLCHLTFSVIL